MKPIFENNALFTEQWNTAMTPNLCTHKIVHSSAMYMYNHNLNVIRKGSK